jgi:hypothetical protein
VALEPDWSSCWDVATAAFVRALPCVSYVLVARTIRLASKVLIGLVALALGHVLYTVAAPPFAAVATAYAYFVAVSAVVPWLALQLRARRLTTGALFACCTVAYVGLPAVLWPSDAKSAVVLVLGWDALLSSYSYCVEVSQSRDDPVLGDCIFFLLVNPALVYARRGDSIGSPALNLRATARIGLALCISLATASLIHPAYLSLRGAASRTASAGVVSIAGLGALRFLIQYARQSALASLQIGLLRQVGYSLPERYVWPLASSGPIDFFQRWNTYVSQWLLRYVFWPASLRLSRYAWRRKARLYRPVVIGSATMLTFGACGLLHDALVYLTDFVVWARMLVVFFLGGLFVLAALGCERIWWTIEGVIGRSNLLCLIRASFTRVVLWSAIVAIFYRWFP